MKSQPTEDLGVLKNSMKRVYAFQIELEFESVGRGNRRTWRKTSRSNGENQQQTQPTYGVSVWYGNIGCLPWSG